MGTAMTEVPPDMYPGLTIRDEDRSAFGLDWEYHRRGWSPDNCPLRGRSALDFR